MQIEFEEITKIEQEDYSGDVFNLSTTVEEYIVSDVVVHNCPHYWSIRPGLILLAPGCAILWAGE